MMATKLPTPFDPAQSRATDRSETKSTEGHPDAQHRRSSERDGKLRPKTAEGASIDVTDSLRDDPAHFVVKLRPRHDGWTAERQIHFIETLAETGCVEHACRAVGMTDTSAYRLRARPCGAAFRAAWDAALDCALTRLEQAALARALHGTPRPVFFHGEQVGEWRHYDERLTMFLLRARRAGRYGRLVERGPQMWPPPPPLALDAQGEPVPPPPPEDPAIALDGQLDVIELTAPADDGNAEYDE
jgi:hypothetical protein